MPPLGYLLHTVPRLRLVNAVTAMQEVSWGERLKYAWSWMNGTYIWSQIVALGSTKARAHGAAAAAAAVAAAGKKIK